MPHDWIAFVNDLKFSNRESFSSDFIFFSSFLLFFLLCYVLSKLPVHGCLCICTFGTIGIVVLSHWSCSVIYFTAESSVSSVGNVVFLIKSGNWFVVY